MHRLRHRQGRDDGSPADSHTLRLRCEADGWQGRGKLCEIRTGCLKTHNPGNPSDKHGRQPSNNFRQMGDYELQGVSPQSAVLSEPIPWETRGIVRILTAEAVNLAAPVIIVVGLWLDQGVERIYNLSVPDYNNSY